MSALHQDAKESFLSLMSLTLLVETKAKHADFYGRTGRDKSKISDLALICSVSLSQVDSTTKEINVFKSRKR